MVEAENGTARELSLSTFLEARARGATDSRLALDVGVGASAVIVAAGLRPEWWLLLASAGLCLASFGIWAAARRTVSVYAPLGAVVRIAGTLAGVTGIASALAATFFLWARLMGTWIS